MKEFSKYQNLIKKHLLNYKDRGFRQINERLYCDFCEYSIKIDRKHIKAQIQSHLRSQKHQNNERSKIDICKNSQIDFNSNEENSYLFENLDLINNIEKITCDVSLNLENIDNFTLEEDESNSLISQSSLMVSSIRKQSTQNKNLNSTLSEYQNYKRLKISEPSINVINVQLNRTEKKNAIDDIMFNEINDCFKKLDCDQYFRSCILSSNSNIFCAGIDFQTLMSKWPTDTLDPSRRAIKIRNSLRHLQNCFYSLAQCQKPIIAAVNGKCIGAGVSLLSFTDIRYCTKEALFSVKEIDLGLAADVGVLQVLPRLIGNHSFLREIIYTGKSFNSDEAKEMGLVSKICENEQVLFENCLQLAKQIASKSPVAVQSSKVFLEYSKDHTVLDGLNYAAAWNMTMLQSEDLVKGTLSLMNKSKEPVQFEDF